MGIFDVFKGKTPDLTPKIAFAVSLLFMTSADGAIEQEEFGVLLSNLHGDEKLLDAAMAYGRNTNFEVFLDASAALLNVSQKHCILLNLADSLLADGRAAPQEQALFDRFLQGWGVSNEDFQPHLNVIVKKNDHSVFGQYWSRQKMNAPTNRGNLFIGQGVTAKGIFDVPSEAAINGEMSGNLTADKVVVGKSWKLTADTTSNVVDVAGEVVQKTVARKSLIIRPGGIVSGDTSYGDLEIMKGGEIIGSISHVESSEPTKPTK